MPRYADAVKQATLRELNSNSSALARRAQAGEVVTITDRGVPIADIVPHRHRPHGVPKREATAMFIALAAVSRHGANSAALRNQLDQLVDPYEVLDATR